MHGVNVANKIEIIKDGIKKLTNNDGEYIFWTYADIVEPYVEKFLKLQFPNGLVLHENYLSVLGLFEFENRGGSASTAAFVDRFYIREYFPGYLRNRDTWDHLLGRRIQGRKLDMILKKEYAITKGVDYFWNMAANI